MATLLHKNANLFPSELSQSTCFDFTVISSTVALFLIIVTVIACTCGGGKRKINEKKRSVESIELAESQPTKQTTTTTSAESAQSQPSKQPVQQSVGIKVVERTIQLAGSSTKEAKNAALGKKASSVPNGGKASKAGKKEPTDAKQSSPGGSSWPSLTSEHTYKYIDLTMQYEEDGGKGSKTVQQKKEAKKGG